LSARFRQRGKITGFSSETRRLSFGGVRAIDGLDLTILPGQVHGLIGFCR
jgi:ABC-type branched-subunit amino acid transport system ATPase component